MLGSFVVDIGGEHVDLNSNCICYNCWLPNQSSYATATTLSVRQLPVHSTARHPFAGTTLCAKTWLVVNEVRHKGRRMSTTYCL
jgi:hypothetical protein